MLVFAGIFLTPIHTQITQDMKPAISFGIDMGVLVAVLGLAWYTLSHATRAALQKRFPKMIIPVTQKTGKTGYSMLSAIFVAFFVIIALAENKPSWLQLFLGSNS